MYPIMPVSGPGGGMLERGVIEPVFIVNEPGTGTFTKGVADASVDKLRLHEEENARGEDAFLEDPGAVEEGGLGVEVLVGKIAVVFYLSTDPELDLLVFHD
jgi:hypothetical protein